MTIPKLERILYVDDDPDMRSVGQVALESLGDYTVATCESGEEALEKAPSFRPDLIILDMIMPGMNGLKTRQKLKKIPSLETVPIVFMTARVQPKEIAQYKKAGAVDVIEKPFDPMSLANKINSIWKRINQK